MTGTWRVVVAAILSLAFTLPSATLSAAPNKHNTTKCLLCHEKTPRFGVDTRETATFRGGKTFDDPSLCAYCHKPEENLHPILVEPGPATVAGQKPSFLPLGDSGDLQGKVVCTTCHFYHAAETDHALLRGFPGSQKPAFFQTWQDFCRDCHGKGLSQRSPHDGDDRACAFCHQTKPVEGGEPPAVASRGAELCNFCHGAVQNSHYALANPFGSSVECFTCHNPHLGPESSSRLKPEYIAAAMDMVTLDPHYRKSLCFACHQDGEEYPLRHEDPVELCNRCHGSGEITSDAHPLRTVPAAITPPESWPLRDGALTCLTCHTAGHPEHRDLGKFLRDGPYASRNDFCNNCHDPEALSGRNPHLDINAGEGCGFCHARRPVPGSDTIDTVQLIASPNILCLRCHQPNFHPGDFDHTVTVDADRARDIMGELPLYQGRQVICATCHNPHIEETDNHKLRGNIMGMMICASCHKY